MHTFGIILAGIGGGLLLLSIRPWLRYRRFVPAASRLPELVLGLGLLTLGTALAVTGIILILGHP